MIEQFDKDEQMCITSALEELQESGDFILREELLKELVRTCLHKLKYFSVLTAFTKQEYTIMFFALHRVQSIAEAEGVETGFEDVIESALEKAYKAAQPNA